VKRSFDELIAGFPEKYAALMVQNPMTFDDLPGTGPRPWRQALFEIFVAAESGARHNDFDTH
jgi:hypothetical protein